MKDGDRWVLSISDNGAGMPKAQAVAGLGTSIVRALASQLGADVVVDHLTAGTAVSIVGHPLSALGAEPNNSPRPVAV